MKRLSHLITCAALLATCTLTSALAQEAAIRKNLGERVPQLGKIDEVNKTPIAGVYELRINGTDILYTDAQGDFLIQGNLIDTKQRRNLTEERVDKLSAIQFDSLPFKDAFTIVRGNGKRKLAVFEDPNCGYCKRFEEGLQQINNVTVYMFLYPVLGPNSVDKSKTIWCAKDKAKTWSDWMLKGVEPSSAKCDTAAVDRNVQLGKKHKINGTPTLIFADGTRVPGAIGPEQVEKQLDQAGS
ncbi:DsbC family protein [Rhodoferax sp. U11-2br]|uniref:DsbC family protein n=1 Tax=Rhodoferax sp. U11-2br TaxID=2838878 RepID=UPI001BEA86CB|nr:DsbC family protein [Rhodoferax sp. U11-2br]MBT3066909.1 DsbC family protein [Rhodoferax sp. U11-2br]